VQSSLPGVLVLVPWSVIGGRCGRPVEPESEGNVHADGRILYGVMDQQGAEPAGFTARVEATRATSARLRAWSMHTVLRSREIVAQASATLATSEDISRHLLQGELPSPLRRDLERCVARLGAVSAAAMVASDRTPCGEIRVFGAPGSERLDHLEFLVGEGPGTDICRGGRSALEPHLAEAFDRWPAYAPAALDAGAMAAFGLPLRYAERTIGALVLNMAKPGLLDAKRFEDASALAKRCTDRILKMQSVARPGHLALALEVLVGPNMRLQQAAGALSQRLGVLPVDALSLMRAYAWKSSISVEELVELVLTGAGDLG